MALFFYPLQALTPSQSLAPESAYHLYPVPQNAPHVSAGMNPVRSQPKPRIQSYGVNVLNFPEGKRPNPEPFFNLGSDSLPLCGLWFGTKATDVSPWYGVYTLLQSVLYPSRGLGEEA